MRWLRRFGEQDWRISPEGNNSAKTFLRRFDSKWLSHDAFRYSSLRRLPGLELSRPADARAVERDGLRKPPFFGGGPEYSARPD
jgi:hypothetical protein